MWGAEGAPQRAWTVRKISFEEKVVWESAAEKNSIESGFVRASYFSILLRILILSCNGCNSPSSERVNSELLCLLRAAIASLTCGPPGQEINKTTENKEAPSE